MSLNIITNKHTHIRNSKCDQKTETEHNSSFNLNNDVMLKILIKYASIRKKILIVQNIKVISYSTIKVICYRLNYFQAKIY